MFTQVSAIEATVIIAVSVLGIYYLLLYRSGILKPKNATVASAENIVDNSDIIPRQSVKEATSAKMTLPPAIASLPIPEVEEIDESGFEMLDDKDSALLKEAERIVDKIQDSIDHIASNPPNLEEVTSKIRAIISPYKLLLETEYYDSINTYIALATERDCGIKFSPDELKSLWN
jgi:hypothetical protein